MSLNKKKKKQPSKRQKFISAAAAGFLFGAVGGAFIGAYYGQTFLGGLVGGLFIGLGEAITDWRRKTGQQKPNGYRWLTAIFTGAGVGAVVGLWLPEINIIWQGVIIGLVNGLFYLNIKRLLLVTGSGLLLGFITSQMLLPIDPVIMGALIVLLYQILAAIFLKNQDPLVLNAEQVPAENIPYVVPFAAQSSFIGIDYFQELAKTESGIFQRNAPDAGIIAGMDTLRGPTFNPQLVHPLIREFYEHTTRFSLDIIPDWKMWMKPVFWLYKQWIAQPIGQANLPFNQEEAQRGVVSYVDTIDLSQDEQIDIRGWVRAFEQSGEAIYVGVYTTFRHDDRGYVSVGFPLPGFNFTATLLPYNKDGRHFILKSKDTGLPFPGHYLTTIEDGKLTVLEMPTFNEHIHVFVEDGNLKTDHRFFLGGQKFLTLHYQINRNAEK